MKLPLHQGNDTNLGRKRLNMHRGHSAYSSFMLVGAGAHWKAFLDFSLPVLSNVAAAVSGEARGFKVEVKGEGTGYPLPLGARGLCPQKNFQSYRCMQVSFSAFFRQKSTH
jgi:hypothetical protein